MATGEAIKIKQNEESSLKLKVTLAEISEVKREHILDNLCYTPKEVGALFGKSAEWAMDRVKDGIFIAVDEGLKVINKSDRKTIQASVGIRILARSIQDYRISCTIPVDIWTE